MRNITCWNDLAPCGIVPLTGESCGLSYRILFDVTEQGRAIIGRWLGVPDITLAAPWNGDMNGEPHVSSIMLSPESLIPIAVFALLEQDCSEIWIHERGVLGFDGNDLAKDREWARSHYGPLRILRPQGTAGDRNVHTMSGRVT